MPLAADEKPCIHSAAMQIVNPNDNGPRSGHGVSLHDTRRRYDALDRQQQHDKLAEAYTTKLSPDNKKAVRNAADHLVDSYMAGRVSRQQIEEEQRADETRLKGWKAAPPQPGTIFADEPDAIRYRMAVRELALEEIASLDLAVMISTTNRDQEGVPKLKPAKPWRAGTGHGTWNKTTGGPISRSK